MNRLFPPHWLLVSLVAALGLHLLVPGPQLLAWPLALVGLVPLVLGVALATWGSRRFGQVGTPISPTATPTVLVVDGPFRYSRNPMYLGFVVTMLGVWLLLGTTTPLVAALGLGLILDRGFIVAEERAMEDAFGPAFEAYRRTTRRWL